MYLDAEEISALVVAACSDSSAPSECDSSQSDPSEGSAAAPPAQGGGWCNFLYTSRCPFCAPDSQKQCIFIHIDTFATLPDEQRRAPTLPNLLQKHMRYLLQDLKRAVNLRARAVLDAWQVMCKWGGAGASSPMNPYHDAVKVLRELGWCLPEREHAAMGEDQELCDAPYAEDVANVLALCARCMHYDALGAPELMLRTISWVISLDTPKLIPRGTSEMPALLDTDSVMSEPPVMTRRQQRRAEYTRMHRLRKAQGKAASLARAAEAEAQVKAQAPAAGVPGTAKMQEPTVGVPVWMPPRVPASARAVMFC
eukprot:TRINITY_DN4345_c0_g1_i1.p1 TRINITY_DN4345_c0_g1~~TRINITY_DN4345_c0_g1_i1.p1  ORF type:complete len:311 (+),score=72.59 TRINITY_DN4345_c0_g1_i1:70-1002(+)